MPADPSHAFAGGGAYREPSWPTRARRRRVSRAWRSFRHNAVLGSNCLLGPNAWCASNGDSSAITIGDRVVCRGVIRREAFGDGRIAIGDDVYVGDDCILSSSIGITIGSGTLLGHGVQIFDNNSHPVDRAARRLDWNAIRSGGTRAGISSAPIVIGEEVWIGFGGAQLGAEGRDDRSWSYRRRCERRNRRRPGRRDCRRQPRTADLANCMPRVAEQHRTRFCTRIGARREELAGASDTVSRLVVDEVSSPAVDLEANGPHVVALVQWDLRRAAREKAPPTPAGLVAPRLWNRFDSVKIGSRSKVSAVTVAVTSPRIGSLPEYANTS